MGMTIANFKTMVAAYVNRADLTSVGGIDILLQSINDARMSAQRMHDFELNKTEDAYLLTHLGGANWVTGCQTNPAAAVGTFGVMKRVDEVWTYSTQVIGATTYYPRANRVDFSYSGRFKRELPTVASSGSETVQSVLTTEKFAYVQGVNLHVTTVSAATVFKLVGIKFLADLSDASQPDIFLTYFTDWLKWATIAALNVYLKDSERFPIDMAAMGAMWESVKYMDGNIANMGEASTLD
jgi:hypothetical protein